MADDYDRGYEAGREGRGAPGGGSIGYAGWAAGNEARNRQEMSRGGGGGGGGGAINFKGKVASAGIGLGLIGMFLGLLSDGTTGGFVGYGIGFLLGCLIYLAGAGAGQVFKRLAFIPLILTGGFVGAVYGVGVAVRAGSPREGPMTTHAIAGSVLGLALWILWRAVFRRRKSG